MSTKIQLSRGFSMIEVMVTIVVVAFGLLGLASLVLRGLQAGSDSQNRTMAVKQTYDMADRMRSNPSGVKSGDYNDLLPSGSSSSCSTLLSAIRSGGSGTPVVGAGSAPTCTGTGATYDNNCWQLANTQQLPSGAGAVCKEATENWYAIFVSWDESRTGATNKTFWITFEP
jgi:type IV pilus assembly protein PilV